MKTVPVVDDESLIRSYISLELTKQGCKGSLAGDGKEALEKSIP